MKKTRNYIHSDPIFATLDTGNGYGQTDKRKKQAKRVRGEIINSSKIGIGIGIEMVMVMMMRCLGRLIERGSGRGFVKLESSRSYYAAARVYPNYTSSSTCSSSLSSFNSFPFHRWWVHSSGKFDRLFLLILILVKILLIIKSF